ncbi:MAG TPA: hypothetical protein VGM05_28260 [Planctomycetaceae bacterium]|jgi:hypothetical protein
MAETETIGTLEKGDPKPQIVQTACLACMPLQICLMTNGAGFSEPALLQRQDSCEAYPPSTMSYWSGVVSLGNSFATFTVFFDIVDGACYLCLSCDALGITGGEAGSRVLITDAVRAQFSPSCQDCQDQQYPSGLVTWTLDLPSGTCTIKATPVSHVSLEGIPPCPDCPDPCVGQEGYAPSLVPGCRLCTDCDCVCGQVCLTITKKMGLLYNGKPQLCNFAWGTPGGTLIGINPNAYTKSCELWLESLEGLDDGDSWPADSFPSPVPIGNRCPDVSASWNLMSTKGVAFSVNLTCAQCDTCEEITSVGCCPQPLPNLLYATVDTTPCNCGQIVVPLFPVPGIPGNYWEGCCGWTECCGHNLCLRLICNGDNTWTLGYDEGVGIAGQGSTGGGATLDSASMSYYQSTDYGGSATCGPLQVKFYRVNGDSGGIGSGIACGSNPTSGVFCDYTVTVTE